MEAVAGEGTTDPAPSVRQFAAVSLEGEAFGFTGGNNIDYAGDKQGMLGSLHYSVQGNTLTSEAVISQADTAMQSEACDLPQRLMEALIAGADNDEGDNRCTPNGIPSDSAYIRVDDINGNAVIELEVKGTGEESAVAALKEAFDTWRSANACAPINMCSL
jgi:uncharacterized Ntn-hydrolase superfamily protein